MNYSSPRMTATFADWPYGRDRTTATFTIERSGRGERATRVTLHPHTGKPSAPKRLTYATKARIVDGDDGRTYILELAIYGGIAVMRSDMQYQHESIVSTDPRYAATRALFE